MTDRKRLNSEVPGKIPEKDIKAWKRDKGQAQRNAKLKAVDGVSPEKAMKIVKLFADTGDAHFISMRVNLEVAVIKRVLANFQINSIEDAIKLVKSGVIGEFDKASKAERMSDDVAAREQHADDSDKLKQHDAAKVKPKKTQEEKDLELQALRDEAQRKNKKDQLRSLIAEGLNQSKKPSSFRIDIADVTAFKAMIPHGVGQLQRRFGGSKKDIVAEVKRLSPTTDVDMLRP
jgi:hypothetical protein